MSNLLQLSIKSNYNAEWDLKKAYFQSIVGSWIASYISGVSIQHLFFINDVPKQITGHMRFHIYFTIRRFMRKFEVMDKTQINNLVREYNARFLKDHYPKWIWQELLHTEDPNRGVTQQDEYRRQNHPGPGSIRDVRNDYKKFIAKNSNGFTRVGLKLLNESIEDYLCSILGAQARAKQSILGDRTCALEVQEIFRQVFEDSVVNYDTSTWINNMNPNL